MARRQFSSTSVSTTLAGAITASASSLVVASATGYPAATFAIVIDPDLATEEIILVGAKAGTTFSTLTRAQDGTSAAAHADGATVRHVLIAADLEDAAAHRWDTPAAAGDSDTATGIHHSLETTASTQAFGDAAAAGASNKGAPGLHKHAMPANPQTVIDAKGDIVAGTAADTWARVAVGTNNQVLTADSAQAGGVKWATPTTSRALIGGFCNAAVASQTNAQMVRWLARQSTNAFVASPVIVDRAGSIVGISVAALSARTAGSATLEVYKNGVATGLTVVLDGTNTQYNSATQAGALDTFVATDRLAVHVTTTSDWAPATGDVGFEAFITVAYD